MGDILITGPASEPVTAAELRAHLRDVPDADSVLEELITDAREYVEEATGLAMISQDRQLTLDAWPFGQGGDGLGWWDGVKDGALIGTAARFVELPRAPLISITSITTYDEARNATVWAAGNYYADTGNRPGRLLLKSGATWPIPTASGAGIVIAYKAGHEDAAAVPGHLKRAIKLIAAHWYENRELVDYDGPSKVPMQADRIIRKARIIKL